MLLWYDRWEIKYTTGNVVKHDVEQHDDVYYTMTLPWSCNMYFLLPVGFYPECMISTFWNACSCSSIDVNLFQWNYSIKVWFLVAPWQIKKSSQSTSRYRYISVSEALIYKCRSGFLHNLSDRGRKAFLEHSHLEKNTKQGRVTGLQCLKCHFNYIEVIASMRDFYNTYEIGCK